MHISCPRRRRNSTQMQALPPNEQTSPESYGLAPYRPAFRFIEATTRYYQRSRVLLVVHSFVFMELMNDDGSIEGFYITSNKLSGKGIW